MFTGVKLDEDLSALVAKPLTSRGYDVATVLGQKWSGLKDPELWVRVQEEKRILITADKGFSDIRTYPPGTHVGIIVLRAERESVAEFARLVERLIDTHRLDEFEGALTIVSAGSIRVRR